MGWIFAELYTLFPIFPGESEIDQLFKLWKILGTPSYMDWPEGYILAENRGLEFPLYEKQDLKNILKYASDDAIDWIEMMLNYNPKMRPSVSQILMHPFFEESQFHFNQPKINVDDDTFDWLKIGDNGIQISKNQKFTGIPKIMKPVYSIFKQNKDILDEKIESEDKRFNQIIHDNNDFKQNSETNDHNSINSNAYPDSALLAHETK